MDTGSNAATVKTNEQFDYKKIEKMAHGIRQRVLELTIDKNGCYLSQALSSAETVAALYGGVMKLGESQAPFVAPPFAGIPGDDNKDYVTGAAYNGPTGPGYDRLLISPAHYAVVIYAGLVEAGRLSPESFKSFNVDGSTVEQIGAEHSPGFELTTGSFGQAISQAGGIAHARKMKNEDGRVFLFMSDGELEEGQTWEGIQAAAHYKLDNLVVYVDVNGQQYDGWTKDVMNIEPIDARIEAFGGTCVKVDGHNIEEVVQASQTPTVGKPLFVLCYTNAAQGLPELDHRKPHLHFVRFKDNEVEQFKAILEDMKKGVR
ncbi:1-deoxy-D-xylulose-5-phosphate synthase N-terminal domain-containing protein [Bacillus sp. B15-48]|uniref:transketolase n=1 Tax=Bacillus sp. B15-48 TaxID=1548601 RepID=UPI00193ED4B6|nr:1-deoxy-D-xylulose-5-phosphate synthase N-terminal domain-containing protein [Bacillus sp. B15-48]MBM4761109.1 transketolase [Bacillus sp. B15-48]